MADSAKRPAQQLFNQVFVEAQRSTYADLKHYLDDGKSIFTLVEQGVQGLARDYGLSPKDAHQFLRRLNSVAIYVRRQFIEQALTTPDKDAQTPDRESLSMVEGPSYEALFFPDFERMCPPGALESVASPVAYLIELLRWIRDRIEPFGLEQKIPLDSRRKDLKALEVDFNAVYQSLSSVDIIVSVLEQFIGETADNVEQKMILARYPNGLPYYQHWETVDWVAHYHGLSVGNFSHQIDVSCPYFLRPQAWDADAGRALAHATGFGPYQRELLTEAAVKPEGGLKFYKKNFGTTSLTSSNLNQVPFFADRTKLDARGLEALLSVGDFAPTRSPNVTYATKRPLVEESELSGSVYVNGASHPPITINYSSTGKFKRLLSEDPINPARYDRMNRKVRLDQWLKLPSEQVDALLVAAIKAEKRDVDQHDWLISEAVVHALGQFQALREHYGCTAQDFAVFIHEMSIYGRGEAPSQFDQVFNNQGGYREPLKLDNGAFATFPAQGSTDLTVNQLCSGLSIDLQTYQYLATAIAVAHGRTSTLIRSPAIVSSFYRLVKLPRLLGITPVEGVLMLTLLGGESWVNGLAGVPRMVPPGETDSPPDVLNLIYALHFCVSWCRERDLPVLWMLQQVSPPAALAVESEKERQLFEKIHNLLPAALLSNTSFLMAGVPPLVGVDWLDLLSMLVDSQGLVRSYAGAESDYQAFAREELDKAVKDGLGEDDEGLRKPLVEIMLSVLLQLRAGQESVLKESLAVYASLDSERVLLVLTWANGTVYELLGKVLEREKQQRQQGRAIHDHAPGQTPDSLLTLLADVRRRSAVVAKLELTAAVLQEYLSYGYKAWLDQTDPYAFSLHTLYYLTVLVRAFESSEQPAQKLLDYLRQVNALPDPLTGDALRLAQQVAPVRLAAFFDWSVQDVHECISHIDPQDRLLKTLTQLDALIRIRALARQTGMDALTVILMGNLPEAVDKGSYRGAAEHALLSLSESRIPVGSYADESTERIVNVSSELSKDYVVAGDPADKVIITVTLTGPDGKRLSGVNVYSESSLGKIATQATQVDGQVKLEYVPGKVMGTDTPLFWLDLLEPWSVGAINVVADTKTFFFPRPLMSREPKTPVPAGQQIEMYATLQDKFNNPARASIVRWVAESDDATAVALIRPSYGPTSQEGVTRVFVSSPTGGEFVITVESDANETSSQFDPITFIGEQTPE